MQIREGLLLLYLAVASVGRSAAESWRGCWTPPGPALVMSPSYGGLQWPRLRALINSSTTTSTTNSVGLIRYASCTGHFLQVFTSSSIGPDLGMNMSRAFGWYQGVREAEGLRTNINRYLLAGISYMNTIIDSS